MPTACSPAPAVKRRSLLEEAEAYRAQVVNEAEGEASRFTAVLDRVCQGARGDPQASLPRDDGAGAGRRRQDHPRRLRTGGGGQGVVPYLPLNELRRSRPATSGRQLRCATTYILPASSCRPGLSSIFIVDEREKALVLQFGQIKRQGRPGLGFKIPFIQEVVRYDDRILSLDTPDRSRSRPRTTGGWWSTPSRATGSRDVVQFRQASVWAGSRRRGPARRHPERADPRGAGCRSGDVEHHPVVRPGGADEPDPRPGPGGAGLGSTWSTCGSSRPTCPSRTSNATFARMRAEREREAADEIARGEEAAQRVRAQADRTVVETGVGSRPRGRDHPR
jgi:membrane protease subunit HflC